MKLSIVLPIYNGESTLPQTLDSLVNQTFQDFELVVCIDGTKDNSLNILNQYRDKFKKMVILENPVNMGLGATMNKLVSCSSGEYIAVAEQDDFYYPERLKLQTEILDNNPSIGLVSGIADFWNGDKITSRFPGLLVNKKQYPQNKELFLWMYREQSKIANSCMMFRKSVHTDNGLYFSKHYPSISVDWSYFLRFSLVSEVYGIPESLVRLDRRVDRNSVTTHKEKQHKAARELIRSFRYEYPNLITKKDYKFAMTTQHLMELSGKSIKNFIFPFLCAFFQNPTDKRWKNYLKNRVKRFVKK
ncbi:glycosyltransferase family 2 protein [Flavobacterium solisilvae]|uniref:Glycosyltransferase n=1 Tax=Flavobacterium solisilvae TaxID=1852019 RepID=A0ABX1QSS6_9FLAO|nr:glycosyltransferase [Flavobacterium solisilvae]NMH25325.1 glycosyltransferase [Flavobacterium solisilvae]